MLAGSQGFRHELLLRVVFGGVVSTTTDDAHLNALAYSSAALDGRRGVIMRRLDDFVKAGLVNVESACQIVVLLVRGRRSFLLLDLLTMSHHVNLAISSTFVTIGRCIICLFFVHSSTCCSTSSFHPG